MKEIFSEIKNIKESPADLKKFGFTIGIVLLIIAVIILAAMLIIGLTGLLKGKTFEYTSESEPEHIRRIKERARMQQELEIAKKEIGRAHV